MSNKAIICVDDEDVVLTSLEDQLTFQLGDDYSVEVAESGEEALEIFEELLAEGVEVPLIISDQIMPGMKGDELLTQVHTRYPKTLKIMLTGQAGADAVGNAVNQANLYRYIAKPWDKIDLNMTVQEAIRSYVQDQKLEEQNRMLQAANEELRHLNEAHRRFVPQEFVACLGKDSITEVELGDQIEQDITILFTDIRAFTTLSEQMTPQENFNFINAYLSRVGPIIREHNGFVDKYMGDAIMALFPGEVGDALQAAIAMQEAVLLYNQHRRNSGDLPINIGIGLHTGRVMLGLVGEAERLEGTVISDAVNLAARLEGLTKLYGAGILISEATLAKLDLDHPYQFRFLDKVKVKGKRDPVSIFEILNGLSENMMEAKLKTRPDFGKGVFHYIDQEWTEARHQFKQVLGINSQDRAASLYLERISRLRRGACRLIGRGLRL